MLASTPRAPARGFALASAPRVSRARVRAAAAPSASPAAKRSSSSGDAVRFAFARALPPPPTRRAGTPRAGTRVLSSAATPINLADSADDDAFDDAPSTTSANLAAQILSGVTVSLAMVPESLAFTFVAGVSPIVGLHAAAIMGLVTALIGAQPGVISGAAGATAVVLAPLVARHGVEYLFAAVALAGATQLLCGWFRLGKFIRLVPQPCMIGFVNGLGIVIARAQFSTFAGLESWALWQAAALTAFTMAMIKFVKPPKGVPSPLVAIASCALLVRGLGLDVKTVGDVARVAGTLPSFHLPSVPMTFETLAIVAPVACSVAAVGLIETLLTQQLVDDVVGTRTATHTECISQGVANVACGFAGAMGGCAMIGQSMLNVESGGRTRVSGVTCALAILAYVTFGSGFIERVPIAALAGTMLCLVLDIFDWTSFSRVTKIPRTDAIVLALVTCVTVFTNLAVAVFAGVVLSALGYAYKASKQISATKRVDERGRTVYAIEGPLFFGSATTFARLVDAREESNNKIVWDFAGCKVWDSTAVSALDDAAAKCRERGKAVVLRHLSPSCAALLRQCGDLVEVNVEEDPIYAVAADYDDDALTKTSPMTIQVPEISKHEDQLEDWQQSALRRQFKR